MNKTISASFNLQRDQFTLNAEFTAPMSGVTALFGSSGSGKTTVLRCLAGLEKQASGFLKVGDKVWQDEHHFVPTHKRPIGYVFQESNLFEHLSITENLTYGMKRTPVESRRIDFNEAVELLGIKAFLARKPAQLSGGQRQRVAIARALLTSPQLLLMDEPLASLDLEGKADILPYLERLHDELKLPIIYVSHAPDEVVRIADRMVLMKQGEVLAQGDINELLTRTDLPLAHLEEACAVVSGKVVKHNKEFHLSYLALSGGTVAVSYKDLPIGHSVRVRILARDVSLALNPVEGTSITNVFPVRICAIDSTKDPAKKLITLGMGGDKIIATITALSTSLLNIEVDKIMYAQVKSVALMR
ncbi:MAG: molybdenum ABC transporter ATP-binding protein [Pseudomonadales bacterium]|nr:molybdenum ABC transporter ATP-binding protein [Pseudomonadales bacterium]